LHDLLLTGNRDQSHGDSLRGGAAAPRGLFR
jgi:hypothetical protein